MEKFFKFILRPGVSIIFIFLLLVLGMLLKGKFEIYRFNHQNIYYYGKFISKGLVYLAFSWSFLYPIIMWFKQKDNFKKHLGLMILAFLPALYFIVVSLLGLLTNNN